MICAHNCTHLLFILVVVFVSTCEHAGLKSLAQNSQKSIVFLLQWHHLDHLLGARHSDLVCTAGHQTPTLPPLPHWQCISPIDPIATRYQHHPSSRHLQDPGCLEPPAHWNRIHWSSFLCQTRASPQTAEACRSNTRSTSRLHAPQERYGHCEECASGRSPMAAT